MAPIDDPVQHHYQAYPYPARDPRAETTRLITGSPSNLAELNHYLFAGRRDFRQPFRALVAGGGTGDGAIMLAQQLADSGGPGEVVYLDLSGSARAVAEARARARSLHNLTFVTAGLEDLPNLGLGVFDYIDCCGVLHHLEAPEAGLHTLRNALAEDGGMGIMVYGTYGRTGLYPLQGMIRDLGSGLGLEERIALTRRLLRALPPTNWFRQNPFLGDHQRGDAELVDLLLHPRDRAYRVPELLALLDACGLAVVSFLEPARYQPATYIKDPELLARLADLDPRDRLAMAEVIAGNLKKHIVYVAKAPDPADQAEPGQRIARPDSPAAVPLLTEADGPTLAKAVERDLLLKTEFDGLKLTFPLPRLAPAILRRIDRTRSLAEIHAELAALDPGLDWPGFKDQFDQLFAALNGANVMLIAYPPKN